MGTISRTLIKRVQSYIVSRHVETGRVPSVESTAKALGVDRNVVLDAIQYLVQSGVLFQSGGGLFLNQETIAPTPEDKPEPSSPEDTHAKPEIGSAIWVPRAVSALMLLTSAAAIVISIYFSRLWLDSFLPPGLAAMLAVTMVIYASVAPQVSVMFFAIRRASTSAVGAGILATSLLVTVFSMVSTVAGQYDAFTVDSVQQTVDQSGEAIRAAEWELLESEEQELTDRIADKQEEVDALQVLFAEFDTLEKRTERGGVFYVNTRNDLQRLNRELEDLRGELRRVRDAKRTALSTGDLGYLEDTRSERRDFYAWVSSIVSMPADRVQFWLSVFPAVFVDVIAPLALAVSLFLARK